MLRKLLFSVLFGAMLSGCTGEESISDPATSTRFFVLNASNYSIEVSCCISTSIPPGDRVLVDDPIALGSIPTPQLHFSEFSVTANTGASDEATWEVAPDSWEVENDLADSRDYLLTVLDENFVF